MGTYSTTGITQGMTLESAQKAQQEYYIKNGATDPALAAAITNLGGGSGDFNQVNPYQQQTAYFGAEDRLSQGGIRDPILLAQARDLDLKAKQTMQQTEIARQEAEARKAKERAASSAASGAAAADQPTTTQAPFAQGSTGAINAKTQPELTMAERGAIRADVRGGPLDRQTFIENQRASGKTDAQIREMLNVLPPEQTGGQTSVQMQTSVPIPADANAPQPAGSPTVGTGTTGTNGTTPTPSGDQKTTGDQKEGQPTALPPNPQVNLLRTLAATETDPITGAILNAYADSMEAEGQVTDPMSQAAYLEKYGKSLTAPEDAIAEILNTARKTAENSQSSTKAFLQGQYDRNEKLMAAQQENINNQLTFANQKAVRDQADTNKKTLDQNTIMLALSGGFGSADGNREIIEARQKGEEAIINLNKEFGFKKTDVALKFTEIHNQAYDNYQSAWLQATDNFETKVSNIDIQSISNQGAKKNTLDTAYKSYVTEIKEARKNAATTLNEALKYVQTTQNQMRDDQRAKEQSVISQAQWAVTTYGSGAKPFIDKLAKENPSVNLAGLMGGQTLSEANQNFDNRLALMKEGRIGGGGSSGGLSFPAYMNQGTGEPPSYQNFVNAKTSEVMAMLKRDTTLSVDEAMAKKKQLLDPIALKAEYDATLSATKQGNPTEIMDTFERRAAAQNLSGPVYKRTQALLESYLKNGQYGQASDVVNNIGDDIDSTSAKNFQQALGARFDIQRLDEALNAVGQTGPLTGRIKSLNPYDPAVVRVNNLIIQAVPNLARGIFNEVGVLTDTDVERYTKTLGNPNLTVEQARNAFSDLNKKISVGMQNQIDVWDAQNKRTNGIKKIFNQPIPSSGIGAASADEDYANSILNQ